MKAGTASNWQGAVLVCGKCSKRVGGGFGKKGKTPLAKALRKFLGMGKKRRDRLGVVETRCLGVCPRDAVVVVDSRAAQHWLLVKPGTPIEAVAARLSADSA